MEIPPWLARWKITGTWEQHLARGSLGGVDFGAPVGTPIQSPSAGRVDYRIASDGSSIARIRRADGTATEFLHGVPYPNGWETRPRDVVPNEKVAISDGRPGAKGANGSTGPHIHAHDVTANGVRVFPFSTIRPQLEKGDQETMFLFGFTHPAGTDPALGAYSTFTGDRSTGEIKRHESGPVADAAKKMTGQQPAMFASPKEALTALESIGFRGMTVEEVAALIHLGSGIYKAPWASTAVKLSPADRAEIVAEISKSLPASPSAEEIATAVLDGQAARLKE